MNLKIILPTDVLSKHSEPYISFSNKGKIYISTSLFSALKLGKETMISIICDEDSRTLYVGKTPAGNLGFPFKHDRAGNTLSYNSVGIVKMLSKMMGWNIDYKKARDRVLLYVNVDVPVRHFNTDLFRCYVP